MAKIPVYQQLAAELHAAIEAGTYPPGSALPVITDLAEDRGVNQHTVRQAYKLLESQGVVSILGRHGTVVRTPAIRIPLSRYGRVMAPGGSRGPWETATADLGLDGRMETIDVGEVPAGPDIADVLEIEPGASVHRRRRRATIAGQTHHTQTAWYPLHVAERVGLIGTEKVVGGIYGAMTGAGMPPAEMDETVTARMPTPEEAAELRTKAGIPLLLVERITRDQEGAVVELLRVVTPADRTVLAYDQLPLGRAT
jgi:GntR family transcriptional regulator